MSKEILAASYLQAQSAAMLVELEGMKVANLERADQGMAFAYDEAAFHDLLVRYDLDRDKIADVLRMLV